MFSNQHTNTVRTGITSPGAQKDQPYDIGTRGEHSRLIQLRTSEHRSMYSYVRLSIIDVQLRTSEHRSMYSYVR